MPDVNLERIKQQVDGTELAFKGVDSTMQRARDTIGMAAWGVALAAPAFLGLVANLGRMKACTIFQPYSLTAMYQVAFASLVLSVLCAFAIHLFVYGFLDVTLRNKEATYRGLAIVVVNAHKLEEVEKRIDEARASQQSTVEQLVQWRGRLRVAGRLFALQQMLLVVGYALAGTCLTFLDPAGARCS